MNLKNVQELCEFCQVVKLYYVHFHRVKEIKTQPLTIQVHVHSLKSSRAQKRNQALITCLYLSVIHTNMAVYMVKICVCLYG